MYLHKIFKPKKEYELTRLGKKNDGGYLYLLDDSGSNFKNTSNSDVPINTSFNMIVSTFERYNLLITNSIAIALRRRAICIIFVIWE